MSGLLTTAQRDALDGLSPKRREFVLHYLECGNATEAARLAGFAHPDREGSRVLGFVGAVIALFREPETNDRVMTIAELREFWSAVARGEVEDFEEVVVRHEEGTERVVVPCRAKLKDKLKATELLGKSQGAFIERREVVGGAGPAVNIIVQQGDVLALASERKDGE